MRELIIDRAKWFRGKGAYHSRLLTSDGKMCCLGFECMARGYTEQQIKDVDAPTRLAFKHPDLASNIDWLVIKGADDSWRFGFVHTPVCKELMEVNDNRELSDEARESRITELFNMSGVTVQFIN